MRLFPGKTCWLDLTGGMSSLRRRGGHFPNPFCQHSGSYPNFVWVLVAVWVGYLSVSGAFLRGLNKPTVAGKHLRLCGGISLSSNRVTVLSAYFSSKSLS